MDEKQAIMNYMAQQRESHANDAAGWAGLAEVRRVQLEEAQKALAELREALDAANAKLQRKR